MRDVFRPQLQPNRAIYDAFQAEARKRDERAFPDWAEQEIHAVWAASRDQAQQLGLRVPTLDEVRQEECKARGHTDYGSTWACGIARIMHTPKEAASER